MFEILSDTLNDYFNSLPKTYNFVSKIKKNGCPTLQMGNFGYSEHFQEEP